MGKNKRNTSIVLTVIGIATLLIALVGATFAYFSATSGSDPQNISTGNLTISSTLGTSPNNQIIPTKWVSATAAKSDRNIASFTLTVNGTGTTVADALYDISLTAAVSLVEATPGEDEEIGGEISDVKYALVNSSDNVIEQNTFSGASISNLKLNDAGFPLTNDTADTYTLYIWIEENDLNQDKLQGATVSASLVADAYTPKS